MPGTAPLLMGCRVEHDFCQVCKNPPFTKQSRHLKPNIINRHCHGTAAAVSHRRRRESQGSRYIWSLGFLNSVPSGNGRMTLKLTTVLFKVSGRRPGDSLKFLSSNFPDQDWLFNSVFKTPLRSNHFARPANRAWQGIAFIHNPHSAYHSTITLFILVHWCTGISMNFGSCSYWWDPGRSTLEA